MKISVFFLLILILLTGCAAAPTYDALRLEKIGPFSATLTWTGDVPQRFVIEFGEGDLLDQRFEENEKSQAHRVTLTGLKPATRYGYRLAENDGIKYLRTAPGKDGAFDLIVLSNASPACRDESLFSAALPDIVVNIEPNRCALADKASSLLIKDLPRQQIERFAYGRYEIVLAADPVALAQLDANRVSSTETPLLIIAPAWPEQRQAWDDHALYVSDRAFRYRDRVENLNDKHPMWLEIDAFEVALVRGVGAKRTRKVIIAAPPETKKSCLYCNRLLEAGWYLESLEWYRAFIRENEERHAVEDAYYSIARILDEKLFDYPRAIAAYTDFIERYHDSRRVILIKYRLDYLAAHRQNDFVPLRRFEQAKSALVRDNVLPTVAEVEKLAAAFPQTPVAEGALYWLGHVLETVDTARAQAHYRALIERFPQGENAAIAAIALGDIQYRAKRYRQAIAAYDKALAAVPPNFHLSVQDKLHKSKRNIGREYIRYGAWAILVGWSLLALAWRAYPAKEDWLAAGIVLAVFVFGGGLYFTWTFERTSIVLLPVAVMAVGTTLLVLCNRAPAGARRRAKTAVVIAYAVSTPPAMIYLVLYHFHLLYVIRL